MKRVILWTNIIFLNGSRYIKKKGNQLKLEIIIIIYMKQNAYMIKKRKNKISPKEKEVENLVNSTS